MSSLIYSMIMGAPNNTNRSASATVWLPSLGCLISGLVLSSSHRPFIQLMGLAVLALTCLHFWRAQGRLRAALHDSSTSESLWRSWMDGSQDAVMVLRLRQDVMGGPMGYAVQQANWQAHRLFGQEHKPLMGQLLADLLPGGIPNSLQASLQQAHESGQSQTDEHVLPSAGRPWLHHQIIPVEGGLALISRDTTAMHESIKAMREQEAFYRALIDSLPMAVFARSTRSHNAGQYVVWNQAAAEVMQMSAQQVLGRKASDIMPPEVAMRGDQQDLFVMREPRTHHFNNLTYRTPSGERVVDLIKAPVYGVDGQIDHILSIACDVTAQRLAAEQLKLASRVIEETGDSVVVTDALDRVVMVNPAFLKLTGLCPAEVIGHHAELLGLPPLRESHLRGIMQALHQGQRWAGESVQVCTDGRQLDTWLSVSTLRNEQNRITQHIRVFNDISALKAQQRELSAQARHDSLTGLPNRRAFGERLKQAMARAQRHPQTLAVMYVDLDGFKAVNDRYGHAAGDRLLTEVARRLLTCVRLTDCVCRLAGDEFTIILEGAGHPEEVLRIGQRILDRLSLPHEIGTDAVVVSPSIGAAVHRATETADELCQRADVAMYDAKHAGKARLVLSNLAPATSSMAALARQGAC